MRTRRSNTLQVSHLRPLAACLAIAFSAETFAGSPVALGSIAGNHLQPWATLASARGYARVAAMGSTSTTLIGGTPEHPTATLFVTNCNDDGPDSLRAAVAGANANDGSTIEFDLNQMQCSTISLTTGQIDITANNLTFAGPGADLLTIDGGYGAGYYNRIFKHSGTGTLRINGLLLTDAKYVADANQNPKGGCIYSAGTVALLDSTVIGCRLTATTGLAAGGGIFASGLTMDGSTVSKSLAASSGGAAAGGGVFVGSAGLTATYSTIENNTAHSYSPAFAGSGGGIAVHGYLGLQFSTIAENHAETAGGVFAFGLGAAGMIVESTFSGNTALTSGGMEIQGLARMYNDTVAFNRATVVGATAGAHAESLAANGSIFAYNVTDDGNAAVESDVQSDDGVITGAKNLIMAANATMPPADTSHECPRLAPLLDNGGPTRTHALLADSPAIDMGSNMKGLQTDQRGSGFDRVVGLFADIGAYEWSEGSGDVINMSGFEACG